jgi:hypothetical protein
VACERDQWGRAIAGHVNVAPRHLTAEAETLLSATLIHEVLHVLGFDPHAFTHFVMKGKGGVVRLLFRLQTKSLEEWLLVLSYLELSCTQGIITEHFPKTSLGWNWKMEEAGVPQVRIGRKGS